MVFAIYIGGIAYQPNLVNLLPEWEPEVTFLVTATAHKESLNESLTGSSQGLGLVIY